MLRHPIARNASCLLLVALAAALAHAQEHHAAPGDPSQCPPAFEAEDVCIEERDETSVVRILRAHHAAFWEDRLESTRVDVEVPARPASERPAWSMRAAWLTRSLNGDEAKVGPLELTTTRGDRIEAKGGWYEGANRRLTLYGPVAVYEGRAEAHAASATVTFAEQSAEMTELVLEGDVTGELRMAAGTSIPK